MNHRLRAVFPFLLLATAISGVVWASWFGVRERADFTFSNDTEIKSVDPHIVTGVPEARIIYALFEGLYNFHPETLEPVPGVANRCDVSDDGLTYTFHLRDDARWSNGQPITAEDFRWSWYRMLHPSTAAKYAYQAYPIKNAQKFNENTLALGDPVEIELPKAEGQEQTFPQGKLLTGTLKALEHYPPGQSQPRPADQKAGDDDTIVYVVQVGDSAATERFTQDEDRAGALNAKPVRWVLLDYNQAVGVKVLDAQTLQVTLGSPTPFFLKLVAFYTLFPVNRQCLETHGQPNWTKPENIVTNGAFLLKDRRLRDRISLLKNQRYWNADSVALETVDALAVEDAKTALNLYLTGQLDWIPTVPEDVVGELLMRNDFTPKPFLATYFYRLNVTRPPLDDVRVRQALAYAINKQDIVQYVTKAGEMPSNRVVPPGIQGYDPPIENDFNPQRARELLAEAGYPGGKGFPKIGILYNSHETHKKVALKIMDQWQRHLGITAELEQMEWGSYLDRTHQLEYTVARAGWIGDYVDPNTFLDMFQTGNPNNQTGWSNQRFDELITQAAVESDSAKRMALLEEAETIMVREMPIIPIYHYVDKNMVRPAVKGFHKNLLDVHPISAISVEKDE